MSKYSSIPMGHGASRRLVDVQKANFHQIYVLIVAFLLLRVDYCFFSVFSFFIGSACFHFPSVGMGAEANKQPVCEADLGRRK